MIRKILVMVLIFSIALTCSAEAAKRTRRKSAASKPASTEPDSVLPKRGDIAVLVEGDDEQQVKMAESSIVDSLVKHGHRVVDEAKMKSIRAAAVRAQAARYALEGNVAGILRLNGSYSCAATVVARIQASKPVVNQFQLYTGNATIALLAVTSRGTKLGGKTYMSKEIGYSDYEAQMKSIMTAVEQGMAQMY